MLLKEGDGVNGDVTAMLVGYEMDKPLSAMVFSTSLESLSSLFSVGGLNKVEVLACSIDLFVVLRK